MKIFIITDFDQTGIKRKGKFFSTKFIIAPKSHLQTQRQELQKTKIKEKNLGEGEPHSFVFQFSI